MDSVCRRIAAPWRQATECSTWNIPEPEPHAIVPRGTFRHQCRTQLFHVEQSGTGKQAQLFHVEQSYGMFPDAGEEWAEIFPLQQGVFLPALSCLPCPACPALPALPAGSGVKVGRAEKLGRAQPVTGCAGCQAVHAIPKNVPRGTFACRAGSRIILVKRPNSVGYRDGSAQPFRTGQRWNYLP